MARKVKTGKARLDKWYRIAKEQGYRSRAAFKLIQLNRKYNFLNNANVLVDLCAAPGGWLQVATRYMPMNSIKIGIDLVSIKHVPGCITFQEDITTPKCLALIKKEIKNEKVDVVLNDGAPNVGSNWSKDAYSQVELVLAAMKLACTVLKKGGTFVTKVFRSADYNSLIWVFNKFFEKVEATKPAASRSQSAEIFIVCLRYIAPDYTDPKLFDARFVFKDTEGDLVQDSNQDKIDSIDKLLQKKRNRQGYADDAPMTMHRKVSFEDFLHNDNVFNIFAKYNQIDFTEKDKETYLPMAKAPEDYAELISDFKILGKREYKTLLNWRTKILRVLGRNKKREAGQEEGLEEEKKGEEEHNTDSELEEEIEKSKRREVIELKREKEKLLRKVTKMRELAPQTVEGNDEIEFDWNLNQKKVSKLGYVDVDDEIEEAPLQKKKLKSERDVEENIELNYELKRNKLKKVEEKTLKRQEEKYAKKYRPLEEEGFQLETIEKNGEVEEEEKPARTARRDPLDSDDDDDDDEDDYSDMGGNLDELEALNQSTVTMAQNMLSNSKWFDRDIFKQGIDANNTGALVNLRNPMKIEKAKTGKTQMEEEKKGAKEAANDDQDPDDEQIKIKTKKEKLKITSSMKASEKRRAKVRQDEFADFLEQEKEEGKDDGKIEVVPALRYDDYDVDSLAEMRVLAKKMLRKKDREEIMEDSYNRYSRPVDEDAPQWFLDDENKHNHKILPITKEEFKAEKERLLAIKNRPIKKIAEAKFRRKMQIQVKLKKAQNRAKDIMEQEGVTETSKLKQVHNLYKKAMAGKKQEKKYIVSRRFNAGGRGGKGKTGRTTRMVDARLKKDKRAQKRIEKNGGGKGKGKGRSSSSGPAQKKKSKKRMVKRR